MFFAAALMASLPCSPVSIAAAASVSPLHQSDTTALGLSHVASGFTRPSAQQIRWQGPCAPKVVGLYGGTTLVTSDGLLFWTMGRPVLEIRADRMLRADPEPQHPQWLGRRFVGSATLAAGTWRIGAWGRRDGGTDIARYRPGDKTPPIFLMTSSSPLIGLFYVGAPDASGGTLYFAQRLGSSRFRLLLMQWSEAGLRQPEK